MAPLDLDNARWATTGITGIVVRSIRGFLGERAPEATGAMAFFAIFTLFPMVLILESAGGYLLEIFQFEENVLEVILGFFPATWGTLIERNMVQILENRGTVGLIGLLSLLWAATSGFSVLVRNVSRAWDGPRHLNIVMARLTALLVVAFLVVVLVLLLLAREAIRVVPGWIAALGVPIETGSIGAPPTIALVYALVFATLLLLYRLVPTARVRWSQAVAGALLATGAATLATRAFTWYLASGLARYNIVYGSLGAFLAFLSWVYVTSLIVLAGAHIGAAMSRQARDIEAAREPEDQAAGRRTS